MDAKPKKPLKPYTNEDIRYMIEVGAVICQKIKMAYPDLKWSDVTLKFTKFKQNLRKFFRDETELEIFEKFRHYSIEDAKDVLEEIYPVN